MSQTKQERLRLEQQWQAHPHVTALRNALRAFVTDHALDFNIDGMNCSAQFVQDWTRTHGPLPPSGIHTG